MTTNEAKILSIGSVVWNDEKKWTVNGSLVIYYWNNDIYVPVIDSDGFTESFKIQDLELECWEN